jgi:hypothetical protein
MRTFFDFVSFYSPYLYSIIFGVPKRVPFYLILSLAFKRNSILLKEKL